ncbi:hypothetical protein [Micromonospora zhanjiangensis]|uniref:Uncharacterized protein n=1 Tax=Micromonospora zhanjiangensis TaxID=1522057 RepID=A0ABV8KNQ3_9ACTN
MNVPTWLSAIADHAQAYAPHIAAGAGAVGMILAAYAIRRFTRDREHDDLAANLGVILFGVVTTEGMWEVVRHKLGVNVGLTIAMFAAFDVVIYSQGRAAIRKLTANPKARVGTYLAIIWALSIAAALTVSTAGGNVTTQLFRLFSPLVAAALWTQKVTELRNGKAERVESNWIWTPTRILVEKGWMKPGAAEDLTEVFRKRRIAALVDAGLELDAQLKAADQRTDRAKASRWRRQDPLVAARRRVQRLTKAADPDDVAAARRQLRMTLNIEQELFRDDSAPSDDERELLDEVRRIMTQATTRVRDDHARGGEVWSNPMIQIRPTTPERAALVRHLDDRSMGRLDAIVDAVTDPPAESAPTHTPTHGDPAQRPTTDPAPAPRRESTRAATRPTRSTVTEPVRESAAGSTQADDKRLAAAYKRLARKFGRPPSGTELAAEAGVSKSTANRWKSRQ